MMRTGIRSTLIALLLFATVIIGLEMTTHGVRAQTAGGPLVVNDALQTPAPAPAVRITTTTQAPPQRGGCDGIYDEFKRQGASEYVASHFAYFIAPRESGCSPQQVHDSDDWSYSRFGLNGITQGLRNYWRGLCNADVRWDTRLLYKDVECARKAQLDLGWAPWAVR
jgi:hypothetical protein